MFGGIDISLLWDAAGYTEFVGPTQPPVIFLKEDRISSISCGYLWDDSGSMYEVDHPAFTALRERLGNQGYIKIERGWWNGDRVTKEFYLNGHYFRIGDQYPSAPAMKFLLEQGKRSNNISELKND